MKQREHSSSFWSDKKLQVNYLSDLPIEIELSPLGKRDRQIIHCGAKGTRPGC